MAGKPKQGLDYAGWATNMFDGDTKIDRLLDAQGWIGFSVYFYLCQMAYKFDGYFYRWSYADSASTARRMGGGVKSGTVEETVRYCLQIGLFDQRLFDEWNILTSRGIQRRFFAVIKDKRRRAVITDYWLLEEDEKSEGLEKCADLEHDCGKDGDVCSKDGEKRCKDSPERKEKEKKEKDTPLTPRRGGATAGLRGEDTGDGANGLGSKEPNAVEQQGMDNRRANTGTPPGASLAGFSPALAEKVQDWLQYKGERREPYKPMGLKSLLSAIRKQARQYGEEAVISLIDQCMAANYRGIIWDKLERGRPFGGNDRREPGRTFTEIAEMMDGGELF